MFVADDPGNDSLFLFSFMAEADTLAVTSDILKMAVRRPTHTFDCATGLILPSAAPSVSSVLNMYMRFRNEALKMAPDCQELKSIVAETDEEMRLCALRDGLQIVFTCPRSL